MEKRQVAVPIWPQALEMADHESLASLKPDLKAG
jgi:hypothetical protein